MAERFIDWFYRELGRAARSPGFGLVNVRLVIVCAVFAPVALAALVWLASRDLVKAYRRR